MMKKIRRNTTLEGLDRISDLPDDILARILSFLPAEQAVRASFLSKRWKSLWTLVPRLNFDFNSFTKNSTIPCLNDPKMRFLEFVELVLVLHKVRPLQKLRLAIDLEKFEMNCPRMRRKVELVMESDCSKLNLNFRRCRQLVGLPSCSFPHRSVTTLKLTGCEFIPSLYQTFVSVRTATLKRVQLHNHSLYDLISKCPCLEELHLIECTIPSHLKFHASESKLMCLKLEWGCHRMNRIHSIEISVPNLLRLTLAGKVFDHLSVKNSNILIEAELLLNISSEQQMYLGNLLKDLHNIKILKLSSKCLEVLGTDDSKFLPTPLCNLKHLTVNLSQDNTKFLGLACLLRSTPCLETLSVNFSQYTENVVNEVISTLYVEDEEPFLEPHLLSSDHLSNLKEVKIKGFQGRRKEMEFIKVILKNSLYLKKMVICNGKKGMMSIFELVMQRWNCYEVLLKDLQKKQEKVIENLLAFPCSSPDAQILLT